jgi:hypothetical protein
MILVTVTWKYWYKCAYLSNLGCANGVTVVNFRIWNQIPACHVVRDPNGYGYVMNVGVTDLDPKPLSCIEKHRKRDCEVLTACLDLLKPETGCEGESAC